MNRWFDRAEEMLERDLDEGRISQSEYRAAIRARDLMPRDPYTTWQDRQRAQEWVQECVGKLPGYSYARPHNPIESQTRLALCAQFPHWVARRICLRKRRQQEALRRLITDTLAHLGPSIVEQNIAAAAKRELA